MAREDDIGARLSLTMVADRRPQTSSPVNHGRSRWGRLNMGICTLEIVFNLCTAGSCSCDAPSLRRLRSQAPVSSWCALMSLLLLGGTSAIRPSSERLLKDLGATIVANPPATGNPATAHWVSNARGGCDDNCAIIVPVSAAA